MFVCPPTRARQGVVAGFAMDFVRAWQQVSVSQTQSIQGGFDSPDGTTIEWAWGAQFTNVSPSNSMIFLNGIEFTISQVLSATQLTIIGSNAPTSGTFQVVTNLSNVNVEEYLPTLAVSLTPGVLFAQGNLWAPGAAEPISVPTPPTSGQYYLYCNSTNGLYWSASSTPTTSGDACIGWVVTNSTTVVALSQTRVGGGPEVICVPNMGLNLAFAGPAPPNDVLSAHIATPKTNYDADGAQTWGASGAIAITTADPTLAAVQITMQLGATIGGVWTPAPNDSQGQENPIAELTSFGDQNFSFAGQRLPAPGATYGTYRFRAYAQSDQWSTGWVLQTTCWNGSDHQDVTPGGGAGGLLPARLKAGTLGAGLSVDVNGNLVVNTSATVGANAYNQLVVPAASIQASNLAVGVVPMTVVSGLPSLPNSNYPAGSMALNLADGKVYKTLSGTAWIALMAAPDLAAGTLAAGVIYSGNIYCSQIQAGAISAALELTAPTLVISGGTDTINIDTNNDILVTGVSSGYATQIQSGYISVTGSGGRANTQTTIKSDQIKIANSSTGASVTIVPTGVTTEGLLATGSATIDGNLTVGGSIYESGVLIDSKFAPASGSPNYAPISGVSGNFAVGGSISEGGTALASKYAPISGSANYAPASGSPNYAPASGSPNYAPMSGVSGNFAVGGNLNVSGYVECGGYNGYPTSGTFQISITDSLGGACKLNGSAVRLGFVGGIFYGLV